MAEITKEIMQPERQLKIDFESFGTAEAFYKIFRALPRKERIAIAYYILVDEDVQESLGPFEIPNEATLQAFTEVKQNMPVFNTIGELQKDLLS